MASNGCRPSLPIHAIVSLVLLLLAAAATCLPASAANGPKQSNKPSLKTVQSSDGDIIDCVPSHLQPAFDHPKLKGLKPLVLYGQSYPRFFIYWMADAYKSTGCYNLECAGFVQTDTNIVLGGSISPTSTYNGKQIEVEILVWKDKKDGNWWLERDSTVVGYWPSSLFSHLADNASSVLFGGEIVNKGPSGVHTATHLGSGYFPEEGFGRAAYIHNLQVVDATNTLVPVQSLSLTAGKPNCYNITKGVNSDWGMYFFFGGPGRSDVCP